MGIKANGWFVYRGVLLLDMIAMDAGGAGPFDTCPGELPEESCNLKAFNSPPHDFFARTRMQAGEIQQDFIDVRLPTYPNGVRANCKWNAAGCMCAGRCCNWLDSSGWEVQQQ